MFGVREGKGRGREHTVDMRTALVQQRRGGGIGWGVWGAMMWGERRGNERRELVMPSLQRSGAVQGWGGGPRLADAGRPDRH